MPIDFRYKNERMGWFRLIFAIVTRTVENEGDDQLELEAQPVRNDDFGHDADEKHPPPQNSNSEEAREADTSTPQEGT